MSQMVKTEVLSDKEIIFDEAVSQGIDKAKELMGSQFGPASSNPLIFHTWEEHIAVLLDRLERTYALVKKIRPELASPRSLGLTKLLIAWHDVVQNWFPQELELGQPFLYTNRGRYLGYNEQESGRQLRGFMYDFNRDHGDIFTQEEIASIESGINATITTFKPELGVIQEQLTATTPFEGKILAFLDINGCLIDGPEQFIREGNNEFKEVKIGINRTIENALSKEGRLALAENEKDYIAAQIRNWLKSQVIFARGRQTRLPQELKILENPELTEALEKELFNKGQKSLAEIIRRAQGLEEKSFEELLELVGYLPEVKPREGEFSISPSR